MIACHSDREAPVPPDTPEKDRNLTWDSLQAAKLRIWNIAGGELAREFEIDAEGPSEQRDPVRELRMFNWKVHLDRDGTTLTVATAQSVVTFDVDTGEETRRVALAVPPFDLTVSPNGAEFVTAERDGRAESIELKGGGTWSFGDKNHAIVLRDGETGELKWKSPVAEGGYGPLTYSWDGLLIAAGIQEGGGKILLLDSSTGRTVHTLEGVRPTWGGTVGVVFSPDDRWLASSQQDCTVLIWDLQKLLGKDW